MQKRITNGAVAKNFVKLVKIMVIKLTRGILHISSQIELLKALRMRSELSKKTDSLDDHGKFWSDDGRRSRAGGAIGLRQWPTDVLPGVSVERRHLLRGSLRHDNPLFPEGHVLYLEKVAGSRKTPGLIRDRKSFEQ